jgi:transcriptional regulator with XRE-family HTH domain
MFGKSDFQIKVWNKWRNKKYRDAYVSEHVRRWIAHQIRALREDPDRKWTQKELSDRMGKPQSGVSRLEDPNYGKMTVQTLLEVAAAFDVALVIKFVSFPKFASEIDDLTRAAMQVNSFDEKQSHLLVPHAAILNPLKGTAAQMSKIERDVRPNQVEFDYPVMSEQELQEFAATIEGQRR